MSTPTRPRPAHVAYSPHDHPVLEAIHALLSAVAGLASIHGFPVGAISRQPYSVQFYDPQELQWYEVVVRPIDDPDEETEED